VNDSDVPKSPDDFSKTTPNVNKDDWGKTSYKHPAQPPSEDWGNTVANVRQEDLDFGKTFIPGADKPKTPDWGLTQANIQLPNDNFSEKQDDYGDRRGGADYGATTPYFRLPEAERAKYQNVPLTPTQEVAKQKEEQKLKGGIPSWLWVSGGLTAMFLFTVILLMLGYLFFLGDRGFEQTVKGAPPGSSVSVDGAFWGASSGNDITLPTLKAGETKKVEIKHPNYVCEPREIKGEDGVKPEPIIARCKQVDKPISNECINIKAGAYDTAEKCANKALDDLVPEFSVDDLLRAMNLYIIQFASGKFDIPQRNLTFLERAAGYMKKLPPSVVVEVGGHTDSDDSDSSNQVLSDNRAKAVREALIKFEIRPEALTVKGYGESQPKATNETADGKFQNRRIEYKAVKK